MNVKLQNVGLIILEEKTDLPLTMINIHLVQVKFEKDEDSNTEVQLLTHDINGSMFQKNDEKTLSQRNLLGSLARETKHEIFPEPGKTVLQIVEHVEALTSQLLKRNLDSSEFQLALKLKMAPNGDKNIDLSLMEFRCYLITSTYLSLAKFANLDDSVKPPTFKTGLSRPLEKGQQISTLPAKKEPEKEKGSTIAPFSALAVKVVLKNIVVTMPSSTQKTDFAPQVLTLRGDLGLALETLPAPDLKETQKLWSVKKFSNITDQAVQSNKTMKILVTLNKFEIFISALEDVVNTEDFNQVRKRNIILPFSLFFLRESFSILDSSMTKLITYTRSKVELEKFILRISYNDIKLIFSSVNYQLEQLSQAKELTATQVQADKKEVDQPALEPVKKEIPTKLEESKKSDDTNVTSDFEEYIVANKGLQLVKNIYNQIDFTICLILVTDR